MILEMYYPWDIGLVQSGIAEIHILPLLRIVLVPFIRKSTDDDSSIFMTFNAD